MIIERTDTEIIIKLPASTDIRYLEEIVDFIRFREIASKSKATQKEVDSLVKEIKKNRWKKNKKRLIGE
ncbi:MAG: hypothetical protein K8R54_05015 [Bacteroidales bacterium]|nr:hypothetical protein [Bacteroidales bacterium]